MRRSAIIPISGGALVFVALLAIAQHYQRGDPALGQGAGGVVGATVANIATGAFGDVGGPIALVALLLVGVVVASNRTLGDLIRPAWERRTRCARARACPAAPPRASRRGVDEPSREAAGARATAADQHARRAAQGGPAGPQAPPAPPTAP